MAAPTDWHEFATGQELADALAASVADRLAAAVVARGEAVLAVSGGTTPGRFFDALAKKDIDWRHVTVTLVDERFVPSSSERSNERLVRERLMTGNAVAARFAGLYRDAETADAAAAKASAELVLLHQPFDVVVLGMGSDGHTASLFPDADDLAYLLDPAAREAVYAVHATSAGEPRLTWPLAVLARSRALYLHIEGSAKRAVLEAALAADPALPIAAVLAHSAHPAQIFWAP